VEALQTDALVSQLADAANRHSLSVTDITGTMSLVTFKEMRTILISVPLPPRVLSTHLSRTRSTISLPMVY
jgi:hypothetical protein